MNAGLNIHDTGFRGLIFYCLFIVCLASPAYAHKVSIYAYAEDGMIHSEGYFSDGTKARNSLVVVYDEKSGAKLLEGNTDEEGKFSFRIPKITTLRLDLHAGMGHRAEYTLSEDEVRDASDVKSKKSGEILTPLRDTKENKNVIPEEAGNQRVTEELESRFGGDDESRGFSDIEAVIERVVDKRLQPVMKMLIEIKEKIERPGFTEVIGGIGYIIGIMGIMAYQKSRKAKKN
ncbi:MAG: hypothetical protein K6360_06410 [Deltaproteobacteria bacterium]